MRDEVLAKWHDEKDDAALHVYCHVSGGLAPCHLSARTAAGP
jgi:hypothetical protein